MLTTDDKKNIKEIVVDVIQEVVMPAFETVATKEDLKKVENRLGTVENRLNVVELKLDRVVENQIDTKTDLGNQERRIKKLESRRAIA